MGFTSEFTRLQVSGKWITKELKRR